MGYVKVGEENSTPIELYYEDHGSGRPVVLIHGWPFDCTSWEKQSTALLAAGYRVIAYDRRGFGKSSRPTTGYEYDTLAADLATLIETLDLRDATLVGFSMGTGEVAHYLGVHGDARVRSIVLISGILPYIVQTPDNPSGVPAEGFAPLVEAAIQDRFAFLEGVLRTGYNADVLMGTRVSEEVIRGSWNVATSASPTGLVACMLAWGTDFRADVAKIRVPVLAFHGTADRMVPIEVGGYPLRDALPSARFVVLEGAPHAVLWTFADEVNRALLDFLD